MKNRENRPKNYMPEDKGVFVYTAHELLDTPVNDETKR